MIMINLVNLSKHYPSKTLFDNLSLKISLKERMAIVGPNGAGKSSLLKMIAGQMEPDSGQIVLPVGPGSAIFPRTWKSFLTGRPFMKSWVGTRSFRRLKMKCRRLRN